MNLRSQLDKHGFPPATPAAQQAARLGDRKTEVLAEAVLQEHAVARRQRAVDMVGTNRDTGKMRSPEIMQLRPERIQRSAIIDLRDGGTARAGSDQLQPSAQAG